MYKFCKNSRNFSLVIPFHRCFEHLFIEWIGVENEKERKEEKKNCLLKVLSIADRLIHSQINRPRTTRRATPSSFTLLFDHAPSFPHHRVLPCLPSLPPSLFPSRFFLGINNFYRPSGRRNGKRRRPFNFSRV